MSNEKVSENAQEEIQVTFEEKKTDVPTLYVNNAQFSTTEWDIRIDLSELHSIDVEAKKMFIVPRLRLVMSPFFATRFFQVMESNLKQFQKILEEKVKQSQEANPHKEK